MTMVMLCCVDDEDWASLPDVCEYAIEDHLLDSPLNALTWHAAFTWRATGDRAWWPASGDKPSWAKRGG